MDLNEFIATAKSQGQTIDISPEALQAENTRKTKELLMLHARYKGAEIAAAKQNKNSWATKLDLDPNGLAGGTVNLAASLASGTTRVAGHLANIPFSASSMVDENVMSQEDYDSYNRMIRATAKDATEEEQAAYTSADQERLNNRRFLNVDSADQGDMGATAFELFQRGAEARARAQAITKNTDFSDIVHQGKRQKLERDLKSTFKDNWAQIKSGAAGATDFESGSESKLDAWGNLIAGSAKAVGNAIVAGISNPGASAEYIVENLPQLAIGAPAMTASNVGYGLDYYNKSIEAHQKANKGQMPDEVTRAENAAWAGSLVAAESIGELGQLAAAKGIFKGAEKTAVAGAKASFKDKLLNTTKGLAEGFVSEAPTEAYQTLAENTLEGKETTAEDMYVAGAIGGIAGAGTSGTLATIETLGESAKRRADEAKIEAKAKATGDVSSYLNPDSPVYAPHKAVKALTIYAKQEGRTQEEKADAVGQVQDILQNMEERKQTLTEQSAAFKEGKLVLTPDQITDLEAKKTEYAEVMQLAHPDSDDYKIMKTFVDKAQQELDSVSPGAENRRKVELERINRHLPTVKNMARDLSTSQARDLKIDVTQAVASIEAAKGPDATPEVKAQAQTAASGIATLSMVSPEQVSPAVATKLASDPDNNLSPTQRAYLKMNAVAQESRNGLGETSKVIMYGDSNGNNKGIKQHREGITQALTRGKLELADKRIGWLKNFAAGHANKAAVVSKALAQSTDAAPVFIARQQGKWAIVPEGTAGATEITPSESTELARTIKAEAVAIEHTFKEMQAARGVAGDTSKAKQKLTEVKKEAKNLTQVKETEAKADPKAETEKTEENKIEKTVAEVQGDKVSSNSASVDTSEKDISLKPDSEATARTEQASVPSAEIKAVKDLTDLEVYEAWLNRSETPLEEQYGSDIVKRMDAIVTEKSKTDPGFGDLSIKKQHAKLQEQITKPTKSFEDINAELAAAAEEDNETTETTKTAVEDVSQDTQTDQSNPKPVYTGLAVFAHKSTVLARITASMWKGFKGFNPIARYMTQQKQRDGETTVRPLVSIENFLSAWADPKNTLSIEPFLGRKGEELTPQESAALADMEAKLTSWAQTAAKNVAIVDDKNRGYEYRDIAQYLLKVDADGNIITNEKGEEVAEFEENVLTAIACAAYMVALDRANTSLLKSKEDIASMHGYDKETHIEPEGVVELQEMDSFRDAFIDDLGGIIIQVLGVKAKKDAPLNLLPRLKAALGTHAMKVMEAEGLITQHQISATKVNDYFFGFGTTYEGESNINYIKVVRNTVKDSLILNTPMQQIRDANFNAGSIADKLFGAEYSKPVLLKAVDFKQTHIKGSDQVVPDVLNKTSQATQQIEHSLIQKMWDLYKDLGYDRVLEAAGYISEAKMKAEYHVDNRAGIKAQNENLKRQLDAVLSLTGSNQTATNEIDMGRKHFITVEVWKNFRVGVTSLLNQQSSKIHRFMFARPSWTETVELNGGEQEQALQIALAQALGIKIDRKVNDKVRPEFFKHLNDNPQILEAARAISSGEYTTEIKDFIAEYSADNEGMMTLQAFTVLAQYEKAKMSGEKSVEVTMLVGADGKTNGPILTHFALGAATDVAALQGILARGGMYPEGESQFKHYSQYAQAGNKDLYEHTVNETVKNITGDGKANFGLIRTQKQINNLWNEHKILVNAGKNADAKQLAPWKYMTQEQWDALQVITRVLADGKGATSDGRNFVKTPITAFNYSAGIPSQIRSMSGAFIDSVLERIEEMAKIEAKLKINPDAATTNKNDKDTSDLVKSLNILLTIGAKNKKGKHTANIQYLPTNARAQQLMNSKMSSANREALRYAFAQMMEPTIKTTMETEFATLIARRNQLSSTNNISFEIYNAAYQSLKEQFIQQMIERGEMPFDNERGNKIPLRDITAAEHELIVKRLKGLLPQMHTAMSAEENNPNAGLFLANTDTAMDSSRPYTNRTVLAKDDVRVNQSKVNGGGVKGFKYIVARAMQKVMKTPGVKGIALAIQSLDSAAMHGTIAEVPEVLNVHDEAAQGVLSVKNAATVINRVVTEQLLEYSPAREAYNLLEKQITALSKAVADGTVQPQVIRDMVNGWLSGATNDRGIPVINYENLEKTLALHNAAEYNSIGGLTAGSVLKGALLLAFANATEADTVRLGTAATLGSVDQYTWEGSQFTVDQDFRDQATKKLNELPKRASPVTINAAHMLGKALDAAKGIPATAPKQSIEEQEELTSFTITNTSQLGLPVASATAVVHAMAESIPSLLEALKAGYRVVDAINSLPFLDRAKIIERLKKAADLVPAEAVSPYGEVVPTGTTSSATEDTALVGLFERNPIINTQRVLEQLKRFISEKENDPLKAFKLKFLAAIATRIDPTLLVKLISKDTPESAVISKPEMDSSAWLSTDPVTGKQEIYLLGREFKYSSISAVTLIHELSHAALAKAIDAALNNPKKANKEAVALVKELETLRKAATKFVEKLSNAEKIQYAHMVSSVHELIAYGMTNQAFQDNVLSKLEITDKNKTNSLVTGIQSFIQSLVDFFFNREGLSTQAKAKKINGMHVLIRNTTALISSVERISTPSSTAIKTLSQGVTPVEQQVMQVHNYTTEELFDALANDTSNPHEASPEFQNKLRNLLEGITSKIEGPLMSLKNEMQLQQAGTAMDVWLKSLDTGKAPFASLIRHIGISMSEQEQFTAEMIEATVAQILEDTHTQARAAYGKLRELFLEAKKTIKPEDFHDGDWTRATPEEKAKAENTWKFIFDLDQSKGARSDYMARFVAMGLASEEFNNLLKFSTKRNIKKLGDTKGIVERLETLWKMLLNFIYGKATQTFDGQQADEKLRTLVSNLVDIKAKSKIVVQHQLLAKGTEAVSYTEDAIKSAADKLKGAISSAAKSNFVTNSGNVFIRAAGAMVDTVAGNRVGLLFENIARVYDQQTKERHGWFLGYLRELKGAKAIMDMLTRMNKKREGLRKDAITYTAKNVLAAFADNGVNLTKKQSAALTTAFLRTGAHHLLGDKAFTLEQIANMLVDDKALHGAIRTLENQLGTIASTSGVVGMRKFFEIQANALGHLSATGAAKEAFVLRNAHAIASMFGTKHVNTLNATEHADATEILNKLIALRAIAYTGTAARDVAHQVMLTEMARTDGNGVDFILKVAKQLEQDSLSRIFNNNPVLMVHGYTHDTTSPYVELTTADEKTGKDLEAAGYTKGEQLPQDPANPKAEPQFVYTREGGGQASRITSAFSFTGQRAQGTPIHNGHLSPYTKEGRENRALQHRISSIKAQDINGMFDPNALVRDLSKVDRTHLVPTLNSDGDIANWRYLMKHETKDGTLKRDNRVDRVLGATVGAVFDRESTPKQNKDVVQALFDTYNTEFGKQPESFILVGRHSDDPEMRDLWRLLPKQTQEDIKKIWGGNGMQVRKDELDIVFGYRAYSLAQAIEKDPDARNAVEQLFANVMNWAFRSYAIGKLGMNTDDADKWAKRASWRVAQGERLWKDVVSETKDIIVIRTGIVLMGNIWSNMTLLAAQGVPLMDMLRYHNEGWKGAIAWQDDSEKLFQLKQQLDAGYFADPAGKHALEQKIIELQDALDRNPVKELMEAGLSSAIVEDVEQDDDPYSYKSAMKEKVDKWVSKVNPTVRKVAAEIYVAPATKTYKFMHKATQLSDFMARYALYQHTTTRKKDTLSKADALQLAADSFINYDVPLPKGMQYLDHMGLIMFTKYFMRIQRVLVKLAMDKPGRVLAMVALSNVMPLGDHVLTGSWIHHFGNNPLRSGMFEYPKAVMELPLLKLLH